MATGKRRAAFFTRLELDILMRAYGEFEHVFKKKSNTAAAAKERETAWESIAARVNECNAAGEKRSWQQLKMKHKNLVQTANRKKADARKTRGPAAPPPPPPVTKEEEQAPSQGPVEGNPGESSSSETTPGDTSAFIKYSDGAIFLLEPFNPTTDEEDKAAAFTEGDPERHKELPVKEIYKMYLLKKSQKTDKEMQYLDRQIRRADLEIEILEHKLEEIKKTK